MMALATRRARCTASPTRRTTCFSKSRPTSPINVRLGEQQLHIVRGRRREPGMAGFAHDREALAAEQRDIAGQCDARAERDALYAPPPRFGRGGIDQRAGNAAPPPIRAHREPANIERVFLWCAEDAADQLADI